MKTLRQFIIESTSDLEPTSKHFSGSVLGNIDSLRNEIHKRNIQPVHKTVNHKDLIATQTHVSRETIDYLKTHPDKAKHIQSGWNPQNSAVIKYQGKLHIADGHHRLAAH